RVCAQRVASGIQVPQHDNSSMDGYVVRSQDVVAGKSLSVSQRIAAGDSPEPLQPGTAARIFTGAPIPQGADSVIMQEMAETTQEGVVSFQEPPKPGQWVRRAGEDLQIGQTVIEQGQVLSAFDVGLLASIGLPTVTVSRRLKVGLLITGSELQVPGKPLAPGQIYNSNQFVWQGLLQQLGVDVVCAGIVKDSLPATVAEMEKLAQCDVVLSSGGVSVGEEDHVKAAVQQVGTLQSWKVSMKPGKPMAFGQIKGQGEHSAWFFGLPGNPVSSSVTFLLVVKPFIRLLQGQSVEQVDWRGYAQHLHMASDWLKPDRRRQEFLRAEQKGGKLHLFANQSSGVLTSMSQSTGLVQVQVEQALKVGDLAVYYSYQDLMR
ncbi:MAG: molybdopterin molybdotransferase MoeA, partial [Limnobacter sp.]|nr:molybdopterin molybdotransferase MoeA [Limnobacter sp.]